jgi:hypothetical protein
MIEYIRRRQRISDILPEPVGVFEDDALLLRLVERSRLAASERRHPSGDADADGLAFQAGRPLWSGGWDL